MLKIIGQVDVKHIRLLPIKTMRDVLKVLTNNITSITAHPNELAAILMIMSVSTFTTADILYIYSNDKKSIYSHTRP